MINKLSIKSDTIGALASSLYMIHCIATPLIFIFQPLTASFQKPVPVWWKALDFVCLIISFFAVYWSVYNTSKNWVKYALWFSWIVLTLALLNEKIGLFKSYLGSSFLFFTFFKIRIGKCFSSNVFKKRLSSFTYFISRYIFLACTFKSTFFKASF